jgi:hypothetical protein
MPASIGDTALRLSEFVDTQISRDAELRAWASGTATGGPNSDGYYPLTDANGAVTLVPSIAKITSVVFGPSAEAQTALQGALNALAAAQAAAIEASQQRIAAGNAAFEALNSAQDATAQAVLASNSATNALAAQAALTGALDDLVDVITRVSTLENDRATVDALALLDARVAAIESAGSGNTPVIYPGLDFRDDRNSMYL